MTLLEETNSYLIPKRKLIIAWRNDHYIFKLFFRQMTQVFYFFCFCHFLLTFSKRKLIIAWRNDHYIFNIYDIQMIFCQMNLPVFYYFVKWHWFSPFFRFCHFLLFFSKLVFIFAALHDIFAEINKKWPKKSLRKSVVLSKSW